MTRGFDWAQRIGSLSRHVAAATLAIGLVTTAAPVVAQSQFTPIIMVGDQAVTQYELDQRMRLLRLLGAPGDVRELAQTQLISERLQAVEAERVGFSVTDEQVTAGMREFAARGNLDLEQMLGLLQQNGIASETFRDFIANGVLWREVVRATYAPLVNLTEAEIDRAYGEAEPQPGEKFLLSEIVLPASSPESLNASQIRADRLREISDAEEFSRAAQRFSIEQTRLNGGQRDWVDLSALPPESQAVLRGVAAGQTSRPAVIDGVGVVIYYVRERETIRSSNVGTLLDYAAFMIPGGRSSSALAAAQNLRDEVDTCDDLYPAARGLPEEQLVREELPTGAVPAAYRAELEALDPGEVSTNLVRGDALVFLMLCDRRNDVPDSVSRAQIATALQNQRIAALANDRIQELRAQTRIEYLR